MARASRFRRLAVLLALAGAAAAAVAAAAIALAETPWGKNRLRDLIVSQADAYLDGSLTIARLEGSLVGGVRLEGVRLSKDGRDLVTIDDISIDYSLGQLLSRQIVITGIALTRPRVALARTPDGRWNLAAIVRRSGTPTPASPPRPFVLAAVHVSDGTVVLRDPLDFGDVHTPGRYDALNATLAFSRTSSGWRLAFGDLSWRGSNPGLTMTRLTGAIASDARGLSFDRFSVATPGSAFTLDGRVDRTPPPTRLDLRVRAARFAFQEWGGVIHGLRPIAVVAAFDADLRGPLDRLGTNLRLRSPSGDIRAGLVLNTAVPGWRASGTADTSRFNLADWIERPDRPSDITGRTTFDLALELGRGFPRGTYAFDGSHAAYLGYAGDDVHARGTITASQVLIDKVRARAYGADLTASGSAIGLDKPYPFAFHGTATGVDLVKVPASMPVPHVDSRLAFDYDISGRFSHPAIDARARLAASDFLGASIAAGTIGAIDTTVSPVRFSADGGVEHLDLHRLGRGLDVGWLQEPRYGGVVSGRFHVQGAGATAAQLTLTGGGRLARADVFGGALTDADVTLAIDRGSLTVAYDGRFANIDPAIPDEDPRAHASLTGSGHLRAAIHDLLVATPGLSDYDVTASLTLGPSTLRDVPVDSARLDGALRAETASVRHLDVHSAAFDAKARARWGSVRGARRISSTTSRAPDLARLGPLGADGVAGVASAKGRASGPRGALRLSGRGSIASPSARGLRASNATFDYDATIADGDIESATGRVALDATDLAARGVHLTHASATATREGGRLAFDVTAQTPRGPAAVAGAADLDLPARRASVRSLTAQFGAPTWSLSPATPSPTLSWSPSSVAVTPLTLASGVSGDQQVSVSGDWRADSRGSLVVRARHVYLETLEGPQRGPAPFGGLVDLDATLGGTIDRPSAAVTFGVTSGRVRRLTYQQLSGRMSYADDRVEGNLRLDQSAGMWLTASGTLPLAAIDPRAPDGAMDVAVASSQIDLGLAAGLTDAVRSLSGTAALTLRLTGTGRAPHVDGRIAIADAGFVVAATGVRYKNARATLGLSTDRLTIDAFHLEDAGGNPLDVVGSLGTRNVRTSAVELHASARHFAVLANDLGRLSVDATLELGGAFAQPVVSGEVAIQSGELKVDDILERVVFRPYATTAAAPAGAPAVSALNPWTRLALNVRLRVPESLRLTGQDVQISPGTPIGLGSINMRAGGELWLEKDAGGPLTVYGSLDSMSGTYAFQGRRFEIDPGSSINFRGDLSPDVFITVARTISGVDARVTIAGSLASPELRLTSTPPLDASNILSLVVFNTSLNQLSAGSSRIWRSAPARWPRASSPRRSSRRSRARPAWTCSSFSRPARSARARS